MKPAWASIRVALRRTTICFGLIVAMTVSWAGYLRMSGNFHEVEAGVLYRSAQLSQAQFERYIRDHAIRTIINLRGPNPGERWYIDEMKAMSQPSLLHIDFPLSANREVSDEKIGELLRLLRDSPRPILVHCEGGADRSGLASALFELVIENRSARTAEKQLSFWYGHFPWLGSRTIAMDKSFARAATAHELDMRGPLARD